MTNLEKRVQQKGCKCKQSKCMKLYCECLSMRVPCNELCSCIDCHNKDNNRQNSIVDRKKSKQQLLRVQKGCSCRRSNCTKKYCDCFQSGILCNESCKCVDCQNNESLANLKVINQLRKNNSDISNYENNSNLYPLYLSQNSEHLNSIITQSNPLRLEENWLEKCAMKLYSSAINNKHKLIFIKMLQILNELEQNITEQKKDQQKQFSQQDLKEQKQLIDQQQINYKQENNNQGKHQQIVNQKQERQIMQEKQQEYQSQIKNQQNMQNHQNKQKKKNSQLDQQQQLNK